MNHLPRYNPICANYYNIRGFTYENRPDHLQSGNFHPVNSGHMIANKIYLSVKYDLSRKWGNYVGAKNKWFPPIVSLPNLSAGTMLNFMYTSAHITQKYLIKEDFQIIVYAGEYDQTFDYANLFKIIKKNYTKNRFKLQYSKRWEEKNGYSVKRFDNFHLAMIFNSGHIVDLDQPKRVFEFVKNSLSGNY